jgi:integrase
MANISNRSPWVAKLPGKEPQRFRLKKQALAHLSAAGLDPLKLPRGALKQLETAYEVQIHRTDSDGTTIKRSATLDSLDQATQWAKDTEDGLERQLRKHGAFSNTFETITLREALELLHAEHYLGTASSTEIGYRVNHLSDWLGPQKLLRDITRQDLFGFRDMLKKEKYSGSSIRNYFTVLTTLYKHADSEWRFPIENMAAGIPLPKPNNAIQRDWAGDERDRLIKSLEQRSLWLIPIVELALEMAFRRGELVQSAKNKKTGEQHGGLCWEDIDWATEKLRLKKEKNDHTKDLTEYEGRTVPLSPRMIEILRPLYDASQTKRGLVFSGTINSVSTSFKNSCRKAEPPIVGLTFHSLRKIATKSLSKRVDSAMHLRRLTGHKNIEILDKRYFEVSVEELAAMLKGSSGSLLHRGMKALAQKLDISEIKKFIEQIRALNEAADAFK